MNEGDGTERASLLFHLNVSHDAVNLKDRRRSMSVSSVSSVGSRAGFPVVPFSKYKFREASVTHNQAKPRWNAWNYFGVPA